MTKSKKPYVQAKREKQHGKVKYQKRKLLEKEGSIIIKEYKVTNNGN